MTATSGKLIVLFHKSIFGGAFLAHQVQVERQVLVEKAGLASICLTELYWQLIGAACTCARILLPAVRRLTIRCCRSERGIANASLSF